MAVATLKYITEADYLVLEEKSEVKHEYYAGQIYAMAGGTPEHAQLSSSMGRELGNVLKDKPCRVFSSDLRVRVEATGLHTYPDATVICGDLRLSDERPRAAMNPTILVEVLSDSTRAYDCGEKWRHYQTIPTLTDYLLVWQDAPRVEHYTRHGSETWIYRLIEGLDKSIRLDALGGAVSLADIYRGVEFLPETPLRATEDDESNGNS